MVAVNATEQQLEELSGKLIIGGDLPIIKFKYKNWRGEVAIRYAQLRELVFLQDRHHGIEWIWCVRGYDMDKGVDRNYAIRDFITFTVIDSTVETDGLIALIRRLLPAECKEV